MDSSQLRDLIGQKRPRYKEQYRSLIESISKKGDASGKGNFSSFGAFYQTYMYAFIIGYKLGEQNFIKPNEKSNDFLFFLSGIRLLYEIILLCYYSTNQKTLDSNGLN